MLNHHNFKFYFIACFSTLTDLTLNLLTTTIVAPPSNASKWQMGFNSAIKGLILDLWSYWCSKDCDEL
jgi:hypothetical protein